MNRRDLVTGIPGKPMTDEQKARHLARVSSPRLAEPFSTVRDDAHPVRWSPADGDTPAYLTLKGAAERLFNYGQGDSVEEVEQLLTSGHLLRTPFAFYAIDKED